MDTGPCCGGAAGYWPPPGGDEEDTQARWAKLFSSELVYKFITLVNCLNLKGAKSF